jgi:phage/plasmid-like protein (TIGR03299 family)
MSKETSEWLNANTLIGYTSKRGTAWHYRKSDQGVEPNHYDLEVPVEDVERRLFYWQPEEAPIQVVLADGTTITDERRKAIVRPDTRTVLGVAGMGYAPHPYRQWLIENVQTVLDRSRGDLRIGSAGLLEGGAVAWVQFELPETMNVAGVAFRPFLTAATSLNRSLASSYSTGAQVVVCDNTLSAALYGAQEAGQIVKRKHTSRSLDSVQDVRDTLGLMIATTEDIMAEIDTLAHTTVADKMWQRFLDELTKPSRDSARSKGMSLKKREELEALYASDERVAPWAGTAYGVVAAVNTWQQHFQTVKSISRPERNMLNMVKGVHDKEDAATLALLQKVLAG